MPLTCVVRICLQQKGALQHCQSYVVVASTDVFQFLLSFWFPWVATRGVLLLPLKGSRPIAAVTSHKRTNNAQNGGKRKIFWASFQAPWRAHSSDVWQKYFVATQSNYGCTCWPGSETISAFGESSKCCRVPLILSAIIPALEWPTLSSMLVYAGGKPGSRACGSRAAVSLPSCTVEKHSVASWHGSWVRSKVVYSCKDAGSIPRRRGHFSDGGEKPKLPWVSDFGAR